MSRQFGRTSREAKIAKRNAEAISTAAWKYDNIKRVVMDPRSKITAELLREWACLRAVLQQAGRHV